MVSTRWLSKPGFTDWSSSRLRSISPAPMSSTMDTATCATTRAARILEEPPPLTGRAALLQSGHQVRPRRQRGQHGEREAGEHADDEREGQHLAVERDLGRARGEARGEPGEEPHGRRRECQPERTACQREQPALGEHLPEEPHPIGAEGGAQGHLAGAAGEPREGEIRDVGAGDEEHEGGGADQEQQGGPGILGELVVQ